mgnify:CR=1 FL=1
MLHVTAQKVKKVAINNDRNLLEQRILSNSGLKGKELENLKARLATLSEQQLQAELSKLLSGNNKGEWYTGITLEHSESVVIKSNHETTTFTDENGNEISELRDGNEVFERTIKSTDENGNVYITTVTFQSGKPLTQTKTKNGNTIETTTYRYNDDAEVPYVTVSTKKADHSKVMTNVLEVDENGNFDGDETHKILSERLENTERAVIPGFYGAKPDGSIQTFSRGGSDITGSIVAKAVHADMYENWTDVSGFLIADPRIIKNPKPIDVITYRELRELSYMGATVLHEDAIFPVRKEGIPINIRNTNVPEDKGTLIVEATCRKPRFVITGIAGKKDFASITIEKAMMNSEIGFCRKVLQVFEDNGVSIEHMPSGIDTMTIFVHKDAFEEKEQKILAGIHKAVNPDHIELESDLALIAIVGRGMKSTRGTAGRIFSALAHAHINVKMIDQGSSELNIIVGVRHDEFKHAIRALYDIFVLTQI